MSNFPISDFTEAIANVLSRVIPPKSYQYLFACLPGLFFEVSILISNPIFVHQLSAQFREIFPFGPYRTLGVVVLLGFIIGNASMLLVGLVESLLDMAYRVGGFVWVQFSIWPLLPFSQWLLTKPSFRTLRWLGNFHSYLPGVRYCRPDDFLSPE